ncbi:chromosome-associated kinesin KIF4 [Caerostris darwini]|uniref:Chromosome-associated kinesin KIF4 n=1 Tax=Caerostris darwini TaxID=1538125 RepID=A0AAV4TBJ5_9ARAC|nr:chromosome-associated kinesin KIF4 [Caerostris darwini]
MVSERQEPGPLNGYNTSIIAYGAIGTGKSYTIGTNFVKGADKHSNAGLIQRILHDLFREMGTKNFVLKVSFLELYKEVIYDLLIKKSQSLNMRDDGDSIQVLGLTELTVDSHEEVFDILENNVKNRKARHSHLMFNITLIDPQNPLIDVKGVKLQFVDLAPYVSMKTSRIPRKEEINVNLGFLSLGKVVQELNRKKKFISYRDSKLTRLLKDSLGGNNFTIIFACISNARNNLDENLHALKFISNMRGVKSIAVPVNDSYDVQIKRLTSQVFITKKFWFLIMNMLNVNFSKEV